jgi:radical SAM superfamily enzyme YgiQ (UPF0313 family)
MRKYKLLLIQPRLNKNCLLESIDSFKAIPLNLITIANYTPKNFDVRIIDENVDEVCFEDKIDLVGISIHSHSCADRAYYLSRKFREKGTPVILGGIHTKFFGEEAALNADSIVVGEVEKEWRNILKDFMNNCLKEKYECETPKICDILPIHNNKVNKRKYFFQNLIQTTRGCPFGCEFCIPNAYYGKKIRHKNISTVVQEVIRSINTSRGILKKFVLFTDDNIIGDKKYAKELFKALIPLRIKWGAQSTANIGLDKELMKLAYESGCRVMFIGFESLVKKNLKGNLKGNLIDKYPLIIKNIHDNKIMIYGSFMFGFKKDYEQTFKETYLFCKKNSIDFGNFHILTPYHGTDFYERLKKENELVENDKEKYRTEGMLFEMNISKKQMYNGIKTIYNKFYKIRNIINRSIEVYKYSGLKYALLFFYLSIQIKIKLKWDKI